MAAVDKTSFKYYFKTNRFKEGFEILVGKLPQDISQWEQNDRRNALTALQLAIIYQSPEAVKGIYRKYEKAIRNGGKTMDFETELINARIAYNRGYNLRAYRILDLLNKAITDHFDDPGKTLSTREAWNKYFLLTRVNDLAGKALHRDSDHTLARLHTALAFDRMRKADTFRPGSGTYMMGKIYTIFARSYFDFPNFSDTDLGSENIVPDKLSASDESGHKRSKIVQLLDHADKYYDKYFGHQGRTNLFYSEVHELRALYYIRIRESRVPDAKNWFTSALEALARAKTVLQGAIKDPNHRRYAHLLRFKGLAYLRQAQSLRRYSPGQDDEVLRMLLKADEIYRQEIEIRTTFFGHRSHPTFSRVFNYRARVNIILGELAAEQADWESFHDYCSKAESYIDEAVRANLKTEEDCLIDEEYSRKFDMPLGKQQQYINDYQLFRSFGRRLQLLNLRYRFAQSDEDRIKIFAAISDSYDNCLEAREETLSWLIWDESRQTIIDELRHMQEAVLEVYHLHQDQFPNQRRSIFEQMLLIHLQGNRDEDYYSRHKEKALRHKDVIEERKLQGTMQMLQQVNLDRMDREDSPYAKGDQYREFREEAKKLIIEDHLSVRNRKIKLESKAEPPVDEVISIEGIFKELKGEVPGCVISMFGGNKYLFALCLYQKEDTKGIGEIRSYILRGKENPFTGVREIKEKAMELTAGIAAIHQAVDLHKKEDEDKGDAFFHRLLCSGKMKLAGDDPEEEDELNTNLLRSSYEVYKQIIAPLAIPPHIKRVYLSFNQGHLQAIPLNLLCLRDPAKVFSTSVYRKFNEMDFLGRKYQTALIPSLQSLWRLRKDAALDESTENNKEALPGNEGQIGAFLGVYGSREWKKGEAGREKNSIPQQASHSMGILSEEILPKRIKDERMYKFLPSLNSNLPHGKDAKPQILDLAAMTRIVHFFCHVDYERSGRFGLKTIILHEVATMEELKTTQDILNERERKIYTSDVTVGNYTRCYLIFINGCGSAEGRFRPGDIPESMMAAFLEGGARGAIGTHYPTYLKQGSDFAENFYNHWFSIRENFPIGEAIRRTINFLLTSPLYEICAHPLHWGSYIFMGDTTLKLSDISEFPPPTFQFPID